MSHNKNIIPFNDNDQPHGYWEAYYDSGRLCYKCVYTNGNRVGYCEINDVNKKQFYLR